MSKFDNWLENKTPKDGDLQVWHIPQVPGKALNIAVATPQEGKRLMDVLAAYDLFQFHNRIKPDYSNASGLNVFEGGEWVTWYSEDGDDIDELTINEVGELVYA